MEKPVVIRGGGDLASGVAYRLFRSGFHVIITEIPKPMVVRRTVSFAEAVYSGKCFVEGITAQKVQDVEQALQVCMANCIPVLIDPDLECVDVIQPDVLVDARMKKKDIHYKLKPSPLIVGLGPGFKTGVNCHTVVETQRGHYLGRVYWDGKAAENTGIPGAVMGVSVERLIRSPDSGIFTASSSIGDIVTAGQLLGLVYKSEVKAPIDGLLRGLIHDGVDVHANMKIGDIDPRLEPKLYEAISDKALAVGGGVLEAILNAMHEKRI